ncbi:hypothetical protein PEX2_053220 [Penicillium expansum]|uniref:Uncharacterized protein n=1 Tax=Penicillium expansum TaxID=27334 RepID=A0A0A2JWG2_PENEN|nr:hypothetical protein PEX2_053220 [Penicillium expansum]KGO59744.1 hypothetical protein PEX2_053220 [Penicillium expansum]
MGLHIQELVTTFTKKDSTGTGSRAVTAVTTAIQYAGIGLSLPHATARRAGQFDRRCLWPRILDACDGYNSATNHGVSNYKAPFAQFSHFGPKGYLWKVNVFSPWVCNSLGLYPVLPAKGTWTHVDLMGFICMNLANDQHVFTSS